jgi:voltage-gated potassium channel
LTSGGEPVPQHRLATRHADLRRSPRRTLVLLALSLTLVALVAISVAGGPNALFFAIIVSAGLATATVRWLFPEGLFFSLTLANLIAVYASIFAFFAEEVFGRIGSTVLGIGFSLPLLAFLVGCSLRRAEVRAVIDRPAIRGKRGLYRALVWLIPVSLVGAGVLILSWLAEAAVNTDLAYLAAMLLIALIVLAVSRDVAIFLVDAGLLFEEFVMRMARLAVPAFAFLTSYSLLVIVFASIYSIISKLPGEPHFLVGNVAKAITFPEAMHFSIVTISTVGYGDIVPASNFARVLASMEVICGVMLLLFGVSELLEYAREHRRDRDG